MREAPTGALRVPIPSSQPGHPGEQESGGAAGWHKTYSDLIQQPVAPHWTSAPPSTALRAEHTTEKKWASDGGRVCTAIRCWGKVTTMTAALGREQQRHQGTKRHHEGVFNRVLSVSWRERGFQNTGQRREGTRDHFSSMNCFHLETVSAHYTRLIALVPWADCQTATRSFIFGKIKHFNTRWTPDPRERERERKWFGLGRKKIN